MSFSEGLQLLIAVAIPLMMLWLGRRMDRIDKRGEVRKQENSLILQAILCFAGAILETGRAVQTGHHNGALSAALEKTEECKDEVEKHLTTK